MLKLLYKLNDKIPFEPILILSVIIFISCMIFAHTDNEEIIIEEIPYEQDLIVEEINLDQDAYYEITGEHLYESLGEFSCTAYCSCEKCCGIYASPKYRPNGKVLTASGEYAEPGITVAVDKNIIPLGTTILIDDHEYIAQDTGAFTGNIIDIYFDDHDAALQYGRQSHEVLIKK